MLTDLTLASLHHLLFFALIAMLATESVLLRGRVDGPTIQRLAGVDLGYGLSAMALIAVGIARIVYGVKGHDFYLHNPWFHAKMATFLLVFAFSIRPTVVLLRWRKTLRDNANFVPDPAHVQQLARLVRIELVLIAPILVFAAMMARYGGF
jgi:putative membrane protein